MRKYLLLLHSWFPIKFCIHIKYFFVMTNKLWTTASETSNTKKYLELIKRRSKVQEKNMSCERALNFDQ